MVWQEGRNVKTYRSNDFFVHDRQLAAEKELSQQLAQQKVQQAQIHKKLIRYTWCWWIYVGMFLHTVSSLQRLFLSYFVNLFPTYFLRELQGKVTALEQSLTVMVREFEKEREEEKVRHQEELTSCGSELSTLRHQYQLQKRCCAVLIVIVCVCLMVMWCREMAHVRKLSRGLLDQRTELESFFISALAQVKKEIATNRHVSMYQCYIDANH